MDGHEGQEHQAGDGQVQDVDALGLHQRELHVPCSLQAHEDVEQHRQEDVLLHDVGGQAKARPVEAHVEVAVAVEVIRTCLLPRAIIKTHQESTQNLPQQLRYPAFEDVEVTHRMDDDEENQQDGTAGQTQAVVGDLDVLCREDGGAHFLRWWHR